MRFWFRTIGLISLGGAVVALGTDLFSYTETGALSFTLLGEMLFAISPSGLNLAQAVTQRYLAAWLWDPPVIWLLGQPGALVFAILGAALVLVARPVTRRRMFRSNV